MTFAQRKSLRFNASHVVQIFRVMHRQSATAHVLRSAAFIRSATCDEVKSNGATVEKELGPGWIVTLTDRRLTNQRLQNSARPGLGGPGLNGQKAGRAQGPMQPTAQRLKFLALS
jgi:hypothetical protein